MRSTSILAAMACLGLATPTMAACGGACCDKAAQSKSGGAACCAPGDRVTARLQLQPLLANGVWTARPTLRFIPVLNLDAKPLKPKRDQEQAERRAWIGVKLSPLPAALAAHVGDKGLLIANIVKGSPADDAGLEQYDVILSFNGKSATQMEDLVGTINDLGADKAAKMQIIRGGKEKTIEIRTAAPKDQASVEYKYADPQEPEAVSSLHGRTLRMGPGGQWLLEDLGQLPGLPGNLRHLFELPQGQSFNFPFDDKTFQFHIDLDKDGTDAKVQLNVTVTEDGKTIKIERDADGQIHIEKTEADGKTAATTYENADLLREKDPEVYEVYQRFSGGGATFFHVRPNNAELPRLQKLFQDRVEQRVKDYEKRGEHKQPDTDDRVAPQPEKKRSEARTETRTETRTEPRKADAGRSGGGSNTDGMSVSVNNDGNISVVVRKDGQSVTYDFKDKADFKKREPELYKRFETLTK